ncbi:TPM domain-containing protein [Snuella sedimenti]|uniref:TPM domain-containing protein n=1 Tax=Snuella sedimenti TaxID=2798802 RepID=A0A8J7J0K6_9FLAO|nr:TPM domain-containing protein [Snuella sedimenti]MBJ6366809.1 TPM domain-containing protein [Snuella sedimenti]
MKIGTKILILFLTLNLLSCKSSAQDIETKKPVPEFDFSGMNKSKFPKPVGYVNDFEQIFTPDQKILLEKLISNYEKRTTKEIAIITVSTIEPYDNIKDYGTDISNEWGIGKKGKDNGLAIIFSKSLREVRVSTGNGTEKILTDEICKSIIDQIMVPEFKNGEYYNGIEKGLLELIAKWK